MSRLLGLIVLVCLVLAGLYYWRQGGFSGRTKAGDTLGQVGSQLGQVGQTVGDKIHDTKVTGQVRAALELNRNLQPYDFDVDTQNSVVVLRGNVPTPELRMAAEKVAAGVPDVQQVRNEILVAGNVAPADAASRSVGENIDDRALEAKVNMAFSLNREMKGSDVKVSAFKRQVALSGTVTSEAQRQLALTLARDTVGVTTVTDQIGGAPAAAPPATAAPAGVAPAGIFPAGTPPLTAPPAAPAAVPAAPGAVPAPGALSDRARAAQTALAANQSLAGYGLTVREESGRLVLAGRVRTAAEKDLAAVLAREAAGMPVDNLVTIQP